MSKISGRQQSLLSVTCAMGRKLSLTVFPQLGKLCPAIFFSALSVGLSMNSEASLREDLGGWD